MRVRIDIGLDFDGIQSLDWEESSAPGAVDVPETTLSKWQAEREAFLQAYRRWKDVAEEVEDVLYTAEQRRAAL